MVADLATSSILNRAAHVIDAKGHIKEDFFTSDGYCAAGAIGKACGLRASDWIDNPNADHAQPAKRTGSLAALRTLVGHLYPDSRPEEMTRRELVEQIAGWNDHPDRTADQVAAAMRAAAREVASRG